MGEPSNPVQQLAEMIGDTIRKIVDGAVRAFRALARFLGYRPGRQAIAKAERDRRAERRQHRADLKWAARHRPTKYRLTK
jgi:hypothetical protein